MLVKNLFILIIVILGTAHDSTHLYRATLAVNGYPLNYDHFALQTRGELKMIEGEPGEGPQKSIPFQVSLRREGVSVGQWSASKTGSVYSLPLNELWPAAQVGDQLVVEPVGTSRQHPPVLVITLKPVNLLMNWVVNLSSRDGC